MSRTKQTNRKSTSSKSCCRRRLPCYEESTNIPHFPPAAENPFSPTSFSTKTLSEIKAALFEPPTDFTQFSKFPIELQLKIWDIAAREPRIVSVSASSETGLRPSVQPPILHVCAASRAVGLKYYTLAFASQPQAVKDQRNPLTRFAPSTYHQVVFPGRVYFNFERDTLWFREDWNRGVDGPWCCTIRFSSLLNLEDLKKVRSIGFDVNARTCTTRQEWGEGHSPYIYDWSDSIETFYLGIESPKLGERSQIGVRELEEVDHGGFMRVYGEQWKMYEWGKVEGSDWGNLLAEGLRDVGCWQRRQNGELLGPTLNQFRPVRVFEL